MTEQSSRAPRAVGGRNRGDGTLRSMRLLLRMKQPMAGARCDTMLYR
jgi:hypothetical protein